MTRLALKDWDKLRQVLADTPEVDGPDIPANAPDLGHGIARHFLRTPSWQYPRQILQVGGCGEFMDTLSFSLPNSTCYLVNGEQPLPYVRQLGPRDVMPREHFDLIFLPVNHLLRNFSKTELDALVNALRPKGKLVMPMLFEGDDRIRIGSEIFFVKVVASKECSIGRYPIEPLPKIPNAKVRTFGLSDLDLVFPGTVALGQLVIISKS